MGLSYNSEIQRERPGRARQCKDYPDVAPVGTNPSLLVLGEVGAAEPECDVGNQRLQNKILKINSRNVKTYRKYLGLGVERLLPDHHEAVGKVEHEEEDSAGRSSNVGSGGVNLCYF